MKRPARRRSSPMKLAPRLKPQAQQHCDAFSKHGLWRCECTESEQKSTKALICGHWAVDLHGGRALRKDNRGPRMLARMRTRRTSCRPGGGRPSSPPERPCPGSGIKRGVVFPIPSVHTPPRRSAESGICYVLMPGNRFVSRDFRVVEVKIHYLFFVHARAQAANIYLLHVCAL